MKTAGELIKEVRLRENISQKELGEMTHIKTSFIEAIENSQWDKLPEEAVVIGFVKSISHFLEIDETTLVALLKREYKPINIIIKQKKVKDINRRFIWGPRLTFASVVIIILIIVLGYLGLQYKNFNSPPKLIVVTPVENQIVKNNPLTINGSTDTDATVEVNSQPIVVEDDGKFTAQINVSENTKVVKVTAKSRSGKETVISRTIKFQP